MIPFLVILCSTKGTDHQLAEVRAADIDDAARIAIDSLCPASERFGVEERFVVGVVQADHADAVRLLFPALSVA